MKKIKLNSKKFKRKFFIIDDWNFDKVNAYKWFIGKDGYVMGYLNQKFSRTMPNVSVHRLIMNPPKGMQVDHKNRDIYDNREENLRIVTHSQNCMNTRKAKGYKSKYKGVRLTQRGDKKYWWAAIKGIYLGMFKTEHQAALAYDLWAKDMYGEFALTNFKNV